MMRSDSSKRSSSSEPEGAELVYFKDNVTIHPTQFASERISGRLKLIKQGSSLFMTWIPYKGQNSTARLSERDRNLYTIREVPFTEVRSIRRHMPAFGWQYIIIGLSSGLAFPSLYFYTGGVREFLAAVKQHVLLVRSAEDANVFLVNDFDNPLKWDKKIMEKKVDEEKGKAQQQLKLKRKHKDVFPFGNYRNYYGYRVGEGMDEDPRFKVLRKEWFDGKDCLDIGCNSGVITIQIAQKFCCRSILGIDIDSNLVANAYWHLRKTVKMEQDGKKPANASIIEITKKGDGLNHRVTAAHEKKKEISRGDFTSAERDLFDIVSFKQENFVHSWESPEKYYDAILCLSVTKWIHLNWGDDGLITLFMRIWRLLHPGGIFVLEPQPWKSYENNRRVSETTAMNFQNIKLYPEQFQEILLDKIGFRTVEDITSGGLSGSKTGFNRPIFLFRK